MSIEGKFLNLENIIRKVFDHTTDSLKVNTSAIPTSVIIDSLDDSIAIGDSITGDKLTVRPDGTIVVGLDATSLSALENIDVTIENVDLDIRNLVFATDKVDVSNSVVALDATTLAALESISVNNFPSNQDVSITNVSLPVTGDWLTDTELRASPVPISGTVTTTISGVSTLAEQQLQTTQLSAINADLDVALSTRASESTLSSLNSKVTTVDTTDVSITSSVLPSGAATSALQASGNASLTSIDTKLTSPLTVSSTNLDIRDLVFSTDKVDVTGSDVTVSGSVAVTGPLTDTELRASAVPISAAALPLPTGAATESTLSAVSNKLPATLGQKTANNSLAVTMASDQVPFTKSFSVTSVAPALMANIDLDVTGQGGVVFEMSGSALPLLLQFSASVDGVNFIQIHGSNINMDGQIPTSSSVASIHKFDVTGYKTFRVWHSNFNTGTLVLEARSTLTTGVISAIQAPVFLGGGEIDNIVSIGTIGSVTSLALPTGASTSALQTTGNGSLSSIDGKIPALGQTTMSASQPVTIASNQSAIPVTGTFFQATQPVSAASLPLPTGAATETTLSALNTKVPSGLTVTSTRLLVDGSGTTQPVSGTVAVSNFPATQAVSAAALPLPTGASTSALQTNGNASLASIDTKLTSPLIVAGQSAVGAVPTHNPVSVSGVDAGGLKRAIKTDTLGQVGVNVNDGDGLGIQSLLSNIGKYNLGVAQSATDFILSTGNSTTTQLAASTTFTGAIETVFNQQTASVLLTSDKAGTLTLYQYIDSGGSFTTSTLTYAIAAGVPFSRSITVNGNYFRLSFANSAGAATTTLNINTAYGTLFPATNLANVPVSLDEINGNSFTAVTKGTQATQNIPVQNIHDAGRIIKTYYATFAGTTTEGLVTLTPNSGGTTGGTATSFTVTAGKTLRIQNISLSTRNAGNTGQGVVCQVRMTASGVITTASPIIGTVAAGTGLAVANVSDSVYISFPDGLELSGTMQIGVSQVGSATANNTITITGYEY